jgi:hypothetical protein
VCSSDLEKAGHEIAIKSPGDGVSIYGGEFVPDVELVHSTSPLSHEDQTLIPDLVSDVRRHPLDLVPRFCEVPNQNPEVVVFFVFHDDPALQFGSGPRSKREVAIELVCYALLLAATKRERVGLLHRSGSTEHRLQPTRDRRRILAEVVRLLESVSPPLRQPCERCRQPTVVTGIPRGSLVLWLAEIPEGSPSPQWRAWARHYDLRGLRVEDAWERSVTSGVSAPIFDPIADQIVHVKPDASVRAAHARWRAERERRWISWWPDSRRRNVMDVAADPLNQFIKMLKAGERRR